MATIKIRSNPFNCEIDFFDWNEANNSWTPIVYDTKPDSKLINDKIANAFFPFKAEDIVELILKEYETQNDTNPIKIVFEGNDDEYSDLEELCSGEVYAGRIKLTKSEKYLENARDILPEIIGVFDDLNELVTSSVRDEQKITREINKFKEASNVIIPICVMGTYSAGKSTFINALIGSEILPSSDQPMTAKIYRISKLINSSRPSIEFEFNGKTTKLEFYENQYLGDDSWQDSKIAELVKAGIDSIDEPTLVKNMNKALEIINLYENEEEISDIIRVCVPFGKGILDKSNKEYVIFDTPGSNSESNAKHLEVLKTAMANLSNGLPIYTSEYQALDTKDNANLYKEIESIKELDDRFTMIIVNKADQARLPKGGFSDSDKRGILSQAVPKKMFSGGLFFVSSIMGLGSKNGGDFIDDYYYETYETQSANYSDPNTRFFKELYKYNILAEQTGHTVDSTEAENNPVYVNSGLYSVESQIQLFADKYSSYNKCKQSVMYLDNIIGITTKEIAQNKKECEENRVQMGALLEKEKKELIERLDSKTERLEVSYIQNQPDARADVMSDESFILSLDTLEHQKKTYDAAVRKERGIDDASVNNNVENEFDNDPKDKPKPGGLKAITGIATGIAKNVHDGVKSYQEHRERDKSVEKEVSNQLIEYTRKKFEKCVDSAYGLLERASIQYWDTKSEFFKKFLESEVTNASELTESEKEELAKIIMSYQKLTLEIDAEVVFDKSKLAHGIRIGKFNLFGSPDSVSVGKLKKRFDSSLNENVDSLFTIIRSSHENSFKIWAETLMAKIKENIIQFNPSLRSINAIIAEKQMEIIDLENRQKIIEVDKEKIRKMMDWK